MTQDTPLNNPWHPNRIRDRKLEWNKKKREAENIICSYCHNNGLELVESKLRWSIDYYLCTKCQSIYGLRYIEDIKNFMQGTIPFKER